MRRSLTFLLLLMACGVSAAADVSRDVRDAVLRDGKVRVLVSFDLDQPWTQDRIFERTEQWRAALPTAKVMRRFESVPAAALEVDAAALAALVDSTLKGRVDLDAGGHGHLPQSLPLAQVTPLTSLGLSGAGSKVAIIDSGIRLDHQSFAGRIVDEACFCTTCCPNGQATQLGPGSGANSHPHGTNVAGIAVGGSGVAGVPQGAAPQASIVSIRVLDNNNSFCCASDIVAALDWLRINHPDTRVANLSLGTAARFQGHCDNAAAFTQAFANVIQGLTNQGTHVVVSSGNNASNIDMSAPACNQRALSVAAVWDANVGPTTILGCTDSATAADRVTCFSNLSTTLDLLAPGAPVTAAGTASTTATSTFFGTSMAAPLVAGCIAVLRSAIPSASLAEVEQELVASPTLLTRAPVLQTYPRLDCALAYANLDHLFAGRFE